MEMDDCENCPLCLLEVLVEKQREEGKRKHWSHARIIASWDAALFRKGGLDYEKDREMAAMMLRAGPPQVIELDPNRPH